MPKRTIDVEKLQQVLIELSQCLELEHYIPIKKLISEAFPEVKEEKWKPKCGEGYWYFHNALEPDFEYNTEDIIDIEKIKVGNCFKTEEECQAKIEEIKKLLAK